jgi:hypothetical protein
MLLPLLGLNQIIAATRQDKKSKQNGICFDKEIFKCGND